MITPLLKADVIVSISKYTEVCVVLVRQYDLIYTFDRFLWLEKIKSIHSKSKYDAMVGN